MPLVLLYDDWDRNPYESPFGPIPHDLAVRLFYLEPSGLLARRVELAGGEATRRRSVLS